MTLHDSNIQRLTLLTDQLSDATRHLPGQYMIPILRPSIPDGTECRRSYANRVDIRPWLGTSFSSKDLASPMIQTESRSSGRRGFSTGCMEINTRFSTCQGNVFTMSRNTCKGCLRSIQERAGMSGKNGPAPSGENNLNQNRKTPPQRRRRAIEMGLRGLFRGARERTRTSTTATGHVTLNHARFDVCGR